MTPDAPADTDTDADADVLFEDGGETLPKTVRIGDEALAVRELSWGAGVRLLPLLRGLLADLRAMMLAGDDIADAGVDALLYDHPEAWLALSAAACGRPREWVEALPAGDGNALRSAAWAANAVFFSQQLVMSAVISQSLRAGASRSQSFSPSSSAPDSAAPTTTSPPH